MIELTTASSLHRNDIENEKPSPMCTDVDRIEVIDVHLETPKELGNCQFDSNLPGPTLTTSEAPQFRLVHILPAPTAQQVQRRRQESEERELARTEAASWAQMTPLIAAILGPLSILLGIPSLTQRWRGRLLDPPVNSNGVSNFESLPDPALELALSGVSLLFEVLANSLLILRFSNFKAKPMTWISYFLWIAKLVLDIANYIQFGLRFSENTEVIYLQGFWVFSNRLS
jgi:hypothetical protein